MFGRWGKNGRLEFTTDRRVCPDRRWFYKGDRRDGRYCRTSSLCRLGGPCRAHTGTVSLPLTHTLCNLDRAEKPAFYSPNGSAMEGTLIFPEYLLFSSDKRLTLYPLKNLKLNSNVNVKLLILMKKWVLSLYVELLEIFAFLKDLTKMIIFRETIDHIRILVRWIFRKELELSEISLFSKDLMNVIAFRRIS